MGSHVNGAASRRRRLLAYGPLVSGQIPPKLPPRCWLPTQEDDDGAGGTARQAWLLRMQLPPLKVLNDLTE